MKLYIFLLAKLLVGYISNQKKTIQKHYLSKNIEYSLEKRNSLKEGK